ncbi:MAG: hypothetical protein C4520_15930 [Candidatus Abyssobacteria bacterium SURF_5]|uniref:Glycosyltransferase RgtA/B/C/D-like domain-containing protein n=1 Tax=Abyssobacteria bacterium (strain SURF_5) TaxID=2093360 RepID=A0A3A4NDQ0_ABYX5|nr:MAG: hypothetical protein C4520_15930 [Candidatus Abyssubacteria bacterium SURF_5]
MVQMIGNVPSVEGLKRSLKLLMPGLILFCLSLFILHWGWQIGIRVYDEGISVYGAMRVLQGDLPYGDFRAVYPPGHFYALALVFLLFGKSLLVERVYSVILMSLIAVLCYSLARRISSARLAVLSWLMLILWMASFGYLFYGSNVLPTLVLSLLSCSLLINFLQSGSDKHLLLAGAAAGATVLFRHDVGVYTIISEAAILLISALAEARRRDRKALAIPRLLVPTGLYSAAVAAVVLPVLFLLIYHVPTRYLIADFIEWPAVYHVFRTLPFPTLLPHPFGVFTGEYTPAQALRTALNRFVFYYPIFILFLVSLVVISRFRPRQASAASEPQSRMMPTLLLLLLGITFLNYVRTLPDNYHLLVPTLPALILLPAMFSKTGGTSFGKIGLSFRCLTIFFTIIMMITLGRFFLQSPPSAANLSTFILDRARGIQMLPHDVRNIEAAVRCVQEYVPKDQRIFVGNVRHDRLSVNDIMFYFLSERESATRYHMFDPGVTTTRDIQREIIREIEDNRVTCVVLWYGDEGAIGPNAGGVSSGITDLDHFIRTKFQLVQRFGDYLILFRRTLDQKNA